VMVQADTIPAGSIRVVARLPGGEQEGLLLAVTPAAEPETTRLVRLTPEGPGRPCPPELREQAEAAARRYLAHPPLPSLPDRRDPALMGVLNLTPDSFSDGGLWNEPDRAVARVVTMLEEGADIIDLGGESTRPGARPVPVPEELDRVLPVLDRIRKLGDFPISIDTRKAAVARAALAAGADWVNDVSALGDPEMATLCAETDCPVVLMHMRGTPETMQQGISYRDPVAQIYAWLRERVEQARRAGIPERNLLVDPGIGFGKRVEDNLEILRRLGEFRTLGLPILVGTSRKSFIGACLDRPVTDRLFGTAATVAAAVLAGARVLRVHDVAAMGDTARMAAALRRDRSGGGRAG